MKLFLFLIFFVFFTNCSFDKKSGIWKDNSKENRGVNNDVFKDFSKITINSNKTFNKIVDLDKNYKFNLSPIINSTKWLEAFYNENNNYLNYKYNDKNKILTTSKKLSRNSSSEQIFFDKNFVFISDYKGNILIYSLEEKKIVGKFNFYKKKFKNIEKKLNIIIEDNKIFVTDNIGYFYAIDFIKNKIIWAKNNKIPLRSNIKLTKDKIIFADQNNNLIFVNKLDGAILKRIPTEEVLIKNNFQNNLSIGSENLFFLNIFGSLYSINLNSLKINWVLNLNESLELDLSNLFEAQTVKFYSNKLLILTNKRLYLINSKDGSSILNIPLSGKIEPIISGSQIFVVTSTNLLLCVDATNGNVIYSYDINEKVANFLKIKKNNLNIKLIRLVNNEIYIYLLNSYIVKFNVRGEINDIQKLKKKIISNPIFINGTMIYLGSNNRLIVID